MERINFLIAGGILGLITGLFVFLITQRIIEYKCKQKSKEVPVYTISVQVRIAFMLLHIALYSAAFYLMPIHKAIFICVFITISIISVIMDHIMHIIANEIVLFLLLVGLIYRLVDGGASSFKESFLALLVVMFVFGGAAAITYLLKKEIGVGAGDVKLSMAIGITLGYPGVMYFLGGMSVALLAYSFIGIKNRFLTWSSSFPMCAHIVIGFILGFFYPYITL